MAGVGKIRLAGITIQAKGSGVISTDRLPDDHPFYALIGRVAAEWAQLEHALDQIIWDLLGTSADVGSCVTSQIGTHASRFRAIYTLARLRKHKEALKEINSLERSVSVIAGERNRFIHDAWFLQSYDDSRSDSASWVGQHKSILRNSELYLSGVIPVREQDVVDHIHKVKERTARIVKLHAQMSGKGSK